METMQSISRTQLITVAVLVLLVAGLVIFGGKGVVAPSVTGIPVTTVEWPSTTISDNAVNDEDTTYHASAIYPETKSDAVNAYFKAFVDEQIASFKADVSSNTTSIDEGVAPIVSTLDITYRQERYDRADNYVFLIASDTGGAHGFSTTKTFSFSKNGTLISLESLFTTGIKGLEVIMPYVRIELAKSEYANTEWIAEGTVPTSDAYESFVVTDAGVRFIFDPYQVAPYAEGAPIVDVPLSVFKSIANPEIFSQK